MKAHFCPVDRTTISYEGECNWCGEKEMTNEKQKPTTDEYRSNWDNIFKNRCPQCGQMYIKDRPHDCKQQEEND